MKTENMRWKPLPLTYSPNLPVCPEKEICVSTGRLLTGSAAGDNLQDPSDKLSRLTPA